MEKSIKVSTREIAIRAFDHLRHERKSDSALRLAHHLLHYDRISLGIGEVDWEIDMAIQKFGGNPRTGYRYSAHFSFNAETEMEEERYEEIFNGKEYKRITTEFNLLYTTTVFIRKRTLLACKIKLKPLPTHRIFFQLVFYSIYFLFKRHMCFSVIYVQG